MNDFPLIIEPADLEKRIDNPDLVIVDLCKTQQYVQAHVPGAIHMDYRQIVAAHPPIMGLLPEIDQLKEITTKLGLTPDKHVVAYDEEGGGKAARLLWTLDAIGHSGLSLLNGGINAWYKEKHPMEVTTHIAETTDDYPIKINEQVIARKDYILSVLQNDSVTLLDTRSTYEFSGEKKFSERAGRIPGAVNMDWILLMDQNNNLKLKATHEIETMFSERGLNKDNEIIVYCQTHHRSALSYIVLKAFGYDKVRGYPGSWSEWGNLADTPVEL